MTSKRALRPVKDINDTAAIALRENELAMEALRLRRNGYTLAEIAVEMGIPSTRVNGLVKSRLSAAAELVDQAAKSELLALELERFDAMTKGLWPQASRGDPRSVEALLKVSMARAKLLGLEAPPIQVDARTQTVLVGGSTEEYVAALRSISGGATGVWEGPK